MASAPGPSAPRPDAAARLPPGQALTRKWPVLHYGAAPHLQRGTWELRLFGEVDEEVRLDWEAFAALPPAERVGDIHCVTGWSRFDNRWRGVPVAEVLALARPQATARFVLLHAFGGWTTSLALEDFARPENLLATHHDGEPLAVEHGGPVRVVVPHLYFWKSAKWLRGIELRRDEEPGFWERNGYHARGDPWREQRYRESVPRAGGPNARRGAR